MRQRFGKSNCAALLSLALISSIGAVLAQEREGAPGGGQKSAYQLEMERQWKLHPTLPVGSPAPDFDLPGTDGRRPNLSEFEAKAGLAVMGGGRRTTGSHFRERYRLLDGDKRLSVVFTWEDPKVFAQPHTYEFRYYRSPKGIEAREFDCNADERSKFLLRIPGR